MLSAGKLSPLTEQTLRRYELDERYSCAFMVASLNTPAVGLDPRARLAANLYNLGLTRGLAAQQPAAPSGTGSAAAATASAIGEVLLQDGTFSSSPSDSSS